MTDLEVTTRHLMRAATRCAVDAATWNAVDAAAWARDYPERHQWWEDMEELAGGLTSGSAAAWSKRYTRREMREHMDRHGDLLFDTPGALCQADDGECF